MSEICERCDYVPDEAAPVFCTACLAHVQRERFEAGRLEERQAGGREVIRAVTEGLGAFYEAGWLDAIRADVAWGLRQMRREARGLQANADDLAAEARWLMAIDEPLGDNEEAMPAHAVRSQQNAGCLYKMAREATERVAQAERWLETTR